MGGGGGGPYSLFHRSNQDAVSFQDNVSERKN